MDVVLESIRLNILVTISMASWIVQKVSKRLENCHYQRGFKVYMALYYGDNVHGNLVCLRSM